MKTVILVDQQEKKPWVFDPNLFDVVTGVHLKTGDYTVQGLEDRFVIERKSLGDLVQTVIHEWGRFRRELYRLATFDYPIIVVEANVDDVLAKRYESEANPMSVMGKCHSCLIDHNVPVVFWGPKGQCDTMVAQYTGIAVKRMRG